MDKLLHERLKDYATNGVNVTEAFYRKIANVNYFGKKATTKFAKRLADEIKKYYVPRPRFENGEPVQFGDEIKWHDCCTRKVTGFGVTPNGEPYVSCFFDGFGMNDVMWCYGKYLKRPDHKVPDANGVPINVGDVLFDKEGNKLEVQEVYFDDDDPDYGSPEHVVWCGEVHNNGLKIMRLAEDMSHIQPTFDADGIEIKVGDTVFGLDNGNKYSVIKVEQDKIRVKYYGRVVYETYHRPSYLTHEKPVYDAGGVRICRGDTVWFENEEHIVKIPLAGTGKTFFEDGSYCNPEYVTHEKPVFSLEKLQDHIDAIDNVYGSKNEELHLQLEKAYNMCIALIEGDQ